MLFDITNTRIDIYFRCTFFIKNTKMMQLLCYIRFFAIFTAISAAKLAEVSELRGEGDYRFATLRWDYPKGPAATLYGFQVHYCELQAWHQHNRCRTQVVESGPRAEEQPTSGTLHTYSVVISGLKMSTNYSFEVRPLDTRRTRYLANNKQGPKSTIVLQTKGFSAKARLCLPDESEVEVSTGPYFTGRIGVESVSSVTASGSNSGHENSPMVSSGSDHPPPMITSPDSPNGHVPDEECSIRGDGTSPNTTYTLRISHSRCKSLTNATSVATFILVQENLPILTHSTRRFLVLCTFHPETLTVRAGLNLPGSGSLGTSATGSGSVEEQISPQQQIEDVPELVGNHVHAMPLQQQVFHHHGHHGMPRYSNDADNSEAEVVLTVVAVSVGIIALAMAAWWFLPRKSAFVGVAGTSANDLTDDLMAESVLDGDRQTDFADITSTINDESSPSVLSNAGGLFTISRHVTQQSEA